MNFKLASFPRLVALSLFLAWSLSAFFSFAKAVGPSSSPALEVRDLCYNRLKPFVAISRASGANLISGIGSDVHLKQVCAAVLVEPSCLSVLGEPIFHYDRLSHDPLARKILVIGLIHGDEFPSGIVSRFWMERLHQISPRNTWRIVPVLNPDGVDKKTRMNARGVDLNRNFPTQDWEKLATREWQDKYKSNPRRFPGDSGGSEPETKCALKHIEDFKPDFVVSIHTPLRVLDFDGPSIPAPSYGYLPWRRLGNFPGSLGRYMWVEKNTPVLTAEFMHEPPQMEPLAHLQDIIGNLSRFENPSHSTAQTTDP